MSLKLLFEKVIVKDNTDRVKSTESSILQQADQIALRVLSETFNALAGRVVEAESSLTLQADQIAARVTTSVFNQLKERVSESESSITQQADAIALKVSTTDFNGNTIASKINQSATTIKLQASKITLEGLITANNNFKILADGSIEAVNAKLSGSITATRMQALSSPNYYGEIGVTGGYVGFGLFDARYGSEAYCEILETESGNGFMLRDKNNRIRIEVLSSVTRLTSPNGNIRMTITDNYVNITNNGVTLANWG